LGREKVVRGALRPIVVPCQVVYDLRFYPFDVFFLSFLSSLMTLPLGWRVLESLPILPFSLDFAVFLAGLESFFRCLSATLCSYFCGGPRVFPLLFIGNSVLFERCSSIFFSASPTFDFFFLCFLSRSRPSEGVPFSYILAISRGQFFFCGPIWSEIPAVFAAFPFLFFSVTRVLWPVRVFCPWFAFPSIVSFFPYTDFIFSPFLASWFWPLSAGTIFGGSFPSGVGTEGTRCLLESCVG